MLSARPLLIVNMRIRGLINLTENSIIRQQNKTIVIIGEFWGGAEGATAPLFFLYFQNVLRFCSENCFIKCSLILSSETLTLLYFASRIRSQCCMLHVLKREVFIRGAGGGGGLGPLFINFLDPPLVILPGDT